MIGRTVAHYDWPFLRRHLELLDVEILEVNSLIALSRDPDTDGLFDRGEYFIGSGFVAIQRYLSSVCSQHVYETKGKITNALMLGPLLPNGTYCAEAIHVVANYWKHNEEWWPNVLDGNSLKGISEKTLSELEKFSEWSMSTYTCSVALHDLITVKSARAEFCLCSLLPLVAEWEEAFGRHGAA